MKFYKIILTLALFAITILGTFTESKSQNKEEYYITPLIKAAKSFLSFAQVPYCNKEVINALACPLCSSILDNSYKVKEIIKTSVEGRDFNAVILQSNNQREIVITFGGPKILNDPEFYSVIYRGGYSRFLDIKVETIFAHVYQGGFDRKIRNAVSNLLKSHPGYGVVLVGHSFGGALATLSAYDLYINDIISEHNYPKVYSYGGLTIGDASLANFLNKRMKVVRIIKNTDIAPVLNNCKYVSKSGWDCSTSNPQQQPNNEPIPVSPAELTRTYYPHSFNLAHGGRPSRYSFLEKNSNRKLRKVNKNKNKNRDVDFHYGGRNTESYYKHADNPNFTWQPIGSEVIFNKTFRKFSVCSYTPGGNGMCEVMQHPWFDGSENSDYFHKKIDNC
jgi:hypothetical protein